MSKYAAIFISLISVITSNNVMDTDFCMNYYPYTYSKCLQICASDLDSTCLDDQLCFCNSTNFSLKNTYQQLGIMERAELLGVDSPSFCKDSKFCTKTCQETENASMFQGILCSSVHDASIKSCVCGT